VTLNLKQRDLIEELLEQRYRNLQKTEDYRNRWERDGMGFFVKNLENVAMLSSYPPRSAERRVPMS
jgi:hypothetical protein